MPISAHVLDTRCIPGYLKEIKAAYGSPFLLGAARWLSRPSSTPEIPPMPPNAGNGGAAARPGADGTRSHGGW